MQTTERMDEKIKSSAKWTSETSRHVKINSENIESVTITLINHLQTKNYSHANWHLNDLHPSISPLTLNWIFVMDLLNFSFWHERSALKPYTVSYNDKNYSGYWSLVAVLKKCHENGIEITNPRVYGSLSMDKFREYFKPVDDIYCEIPLAEERLRLLNTAGRILNDRYNGDFTNLVVKANHSAQALMKLVVAEFGDLFDDRVVYNGRELYFQKRLQILVADIWACYGGQGFGQFDDIDTITMFADYRVPQALLYFGLLDYSKDLTDTLHQHWQYHQSSPVASSTSTSSGSNMQEENAKYTIPRGHQYEIEIRGCSIHAVELLVQSIRSKGISINAIVLDFYLWDLAKAEADLMKDLPIHLTRSIYY